MGNGYASPALGELGWLVEQLQQIQVRLAELETPTGTSMNSLVAQVQQAIANINTTVNAAISANSYTKSQIDTKIGSPGLIAPTDVAASGQVSSNGGPFKSQPSYAYAVATSYKGAWIDGVTYQIGYSASSERVKTDLQPMRGSRILDLTPYWGRYVWDDPTSPPKAFLLAREVQDAGFGPDVAPVVEDAPLVMRDSHGDPIQVDGRDVVIPVGEAYTINYGQLVVPLIAAVQALAARLDVAGL
ncbi:hypothetical protein [uncultured Microbacterium sp.]|uniref:hypothetical protein n=1 Tax=uncultured Microbacterium sp. TaxID=191216 RepID=UPI0026003C9D|nr:hypothetical protein [uncultured Microbacterium sp.]